MSVPIQNVSPKACLKPGRELDREGCFTEDVIDAIYEYAEGHAYVMRLLAGEVAVAGGLVLPV